MGDKTIKKHKEEIVTKVQRVIFFLKGPGSGYDVALDRDF